MSAQHTPGRIEAQCVGVNQAYLVTKAHGHERAIAMVMIATPEGPHNLRRLAACWNACEGIPTDDLEQCPSGGLLHLAGHADQLLAQRDDLLAALQAARLHIAGEALPTKAQAIAQIDAAIARVTKEQP